MTTSSHQTNTQHIKYFITLFKEDTPRESLMEDQIMNYNFIARSLIAESSQKPTWFYDLQNQVMIDGPH